MYGISVGVSQIGTTLPGPVYALLSGLNATTIGVIAVAAVRLSERAITDRLTRFLVYLGGILGMLYTASWYYPAIIVLAGLTSVVWDCRWLHNPANSARTSIWEFIRKKARPRDVDTEAAIESDHSSLDLEKPLHHRLAHIDPTASRPRSTLPHSPPPRPRY